MIKGGIDFFVPKKYRVFKAAHWLLLILAVFALAEICFSNENLYINEVLIEGSSGEEFIELYNPTDSSIALGNYYLAYYSSGRDWPNPYRNKKFPDAAEIKPKSFYLIVTKKGDFSEITDWNLGYSSHQLSDSSGALAIFPNNTFSEINSIDAVSWGKVDYIKKGEELSVPSVGKSLEKKALGWQENTGTGGTPGKENSAWTEKADEKTDNKSGNISIKKDENIYKNIFANFEVDFLGATQNTKYTWNFGDNHKSYLQKTRHKYEKTGTYRASITIRGDQKAAQDFEVDVKEYEAPKIKIIRLSPNPKGIDTKNEWIEIQNNSKKKINLEDWIIATGWDKLINHKITKEFIIKSQKSKKLTSKYCAFTLNNAQNKIELRDPSGETVQKIKYNRKKDKLEEDEIFEIKNKNWTWVKAQSNTEDKPKDTENSTESSPPAENSASEENPETHNEIKQEIELDIDQSEIEKNLGKYSPSPALQNKKQSQIILLSYNSKIKTPPILLENQGRVLGISTNRENTFSPPEKHWAVILIDKLCIKTNLIINLILNKL